MIVPSDYLQENMKERLFRVLDLTVFIFPWLLVGLTAGMWLGEYRLNLQLDKFWQRSHMESLVRERILDYSLTNLNDNKFMVGDAKTKALAKYKEEIKRGNQ